MSASLDHLLHAFTIPAIAACAFLSGCSAAATRTGSQTQGTEAPDSGLPDASVSGDAGSVTLALPDGATQGGGSYADAGPGDGSCADLGAAAQHTFSAWAKEQMACSADTDCSLVLFTESSYCASACSWVLNPTGAASAVDVATQDCASFNAQGCTPPHVPCPGFGAPICAGGTCAQYTLSLKESGNFVHGSCTTFTETYEQYWTPAAAPRDFPFPVTATNGTLYADAACTTPFTSLTLPKGQSSVSFGFVPTAAGPFSVSMGSSGGGVSGDAL